MVVLLVLHDGIIPTDLWLAIMELVIGVAVVEAHGLVGDVAEVDVLAEEISQVIIRTPTKIPLAQVSTTRVSFQLYRVLPLMNLEILPLLLLLTLPRQKIRLHRAMGYQNRHCHRRKTRGRTRSNRVHANN